MAVAHLFGQLPAILPLDVRQQPAEIIRRVRMRLGPAKVRPEQPDHGVYGRDRSVGHLELARTPTVGRYHDQLPPGRILLQERDQGEL